MIIEKTNEGILFDKELKIIKDYALYAIMFKEKLKSKEEALAIWNKLTPTQILINYFSKKRTVPNSLKKAIKEVYYWQHNYTGCFSNKLFDLISNADDENKFKLAMGFPEFVEAYYIWFYKKFEDKTFINDKEMLEYFNCEAE